MGDSIGAIYIIRLVLLFFSSFLLLFIRFEPAVRSVAPRLAVVVELFASAKAGGEGRERGKKKEKRRSAVKHFLNRQSASGQEACRLGSKRQKASFLESGRELGTAGVKGQPRGSLIKTETGGGGCEGEEVVVV